MYRCVQIRALLVSLLLVAITNGTWASTLESNSSTSSPILVLHGASYVAGWGQPALPGYKILNRGLGGDETKDMSARFSRDVIAAKPAVVLIWGHINNITRTTPEGYPNAQEAARNHFQSMISSARAADIRVILATEVPLADSKSLLDQARVLLARLRGKETYATKVNRQVYQINEFLRDYAAENDLTLLDFAGVFDAGSGIRKAEFATEDLSHITPEGYSALTAYAVRALGNGGRNSTH